MTHRRKLLIAVLAGLGLLLLCGAAAVRLLLSDERLAAFARDKVKTSLGRELVLEGLSLEFRPMPTIRLRNAALSNPSWAKEPYFLHAEHATARLDLSSLLRGQLQIASLSIDGLSMNLEVSADGRKTWQMQGNAISRNNKDSLIAPLYLASVNLSNLRVRYAENGKLAKDWHVEELKAHADSEWRDVGIDAKLVRNGIPLEAKATFADLSRLGQDAATSDGRIDLSLGSARLAISGLVPISGNLRGHKLKADFTAPTSKELLGFFGISDLKFAPMKASVDLQDGKDGIQANNVAFEIGRQKIIGNAQIGVAGGKPHYRAILAIDQLDWAQMLRDFGRPELPAKPPGQLFRSTPLGWRAVSALQTINGTTELRIQRVKLRSGIEWKNLTARIESDEKLLRIEKFSFAMLDGQAKGSLLLGGEQRSARLNLEMNKISLGKWLAARGHRVALAGGPLDLKAALSGKGQSMKDLAESLTGPVTIRVGAAKLRSKQVQQAQTWLIGLAPLFSAAKADQVNLACISAYLPFRNGRAESEPIGGIRSDASQVLASGYIDFKEQTMDLRGRVRARSGISLGISNIAGDNLKIAGKITAPGVGLDPESTPGALARIGAAIMTSGVSILATALWDAANPVSDPCYVTFRAHEKKRPSKEKDTVRNPSSAETN